MRRYNGHKIIAADPEKITIEILLDDERIITHEVFKKNIHNFHLARIGLFLRTTEHAIYDVIDEKGNIITI